MIIMWLTKKIWRRSDKITANHEEVLASNVRLEARTRDLTDDEFAAMKAERTQKAKQWAALGKDEQQRRMIAKFRETAETNRKRAVSIGITNYVWLWPGTPECDIGKRNNGKTFSYLNPPPEGHPCEGECHAKDWCRCTAKSVVPGFS